MRVPAKELLLVFMASLMLAACASIGPPEPPSLELPKAPADLRAKRKGDRVTLTWTIPAKTTDRQSVRYLGETRVCRSLEAALVKCGVPVGEAAPPADFAEKRSGGEKMTATYVGSLTAGLPVDVKRGLSASVTYAVEVFNKDNRGAGLSNQVRVPLAPALPPPADFAARLSAQGVALTWTGAVLAAPPDSVQSGYRVFRRQEGTSQQTLVGEVVAAAGELAITDQSFEWQKTYFYHADTLTKLVQTGKAEVSIEGDDTAEVKVFADDVFPPAVPVGLQAVFSGPGQAAFIDLVWSPVADADLAGYNVYRHELGGAAAVKLNGALLEAPAFRDSGVEAGKRYFYAVSAVDQRGNESARSEEAEERVP
jgi:hypothetical protein